MCGCVFWTVIKFDILNFEKLQYLIDRRGNYFFILARITYYNDLFVPQGMKMIASKYPFVFY